MKVLTGRVVSCKLPKTAVVRVERVVVHRIYKKRFKRFKKYMVHDELGVKEGDVVNFVPSRPYSRMKKWKIVGILEGEVARKSRNEEK